LREDALHRDFTINGMFYDPETEQVFDYVGGQHDIECRLIRGIESPYDRFIEDSAAYDASHPAGCVLRV
jgi:tRNA nucleotidyltransferase/poly(A) polymerase